MNKIYSATIITNLAKLGWIQPMRSRKASKQRKYQTEDEQTIPEKLEAILSLKKS